MKYFERDLINLNFAVDTKSSNFCKSDHSSSDANLNVSKCLIAILQKDRT